MRNAMQQYQNINNQTDVANADPHRLTQLLLEGALRRIAEAKGYLQRDQQAQLGEALGKALGLISGLQAALNREVGGDIAANLYDLYDYMARRLVKVHIDKNDDALVEVGSLLTEIKTGWEGIRAEYVTSQA